MQKNGLYRKIKDNRGVTIIMAMVAFLVASMVAVVIVSAALTAAKTVHDDKKSKQNMLYLTSAAKLIRKELSGGTSYITYIEDCQVTSVKSVYVTVSNDGKKNLDDHGYGGIESEIEVPGGKAGRVYTDIGICKCGVFSKSFQELALNEGNTSAKFPEGSFVITSDLSSGEDGEESASQKVLVDYVMYPREYTEDGELVTSYPYKIVFTLTVEGSGDTMFMTMYADSNSISREVTWDKTSAPIATGTWTPSDPDATDTSGTICTREDTFSAKRKVTVKWGGFMSYYNIAGSME